MRIFVRWMTGPDTQSLAANHRRTIGNRDGKNKDARYHARLCCGAKSLTGRQPPGGYAERFRTLLEGRS